MSTVKGKGLFVKEHNAYVFKAVEMKDFTLSEPKDNEILARFLAAPVNHSDFMSINGFHGHVPGTPFPAGSEGVAQVLKKGPTAKFEIGDWIIPTKMNFGTWRTHTLSPESDFIKIDKEIGFKAAATMFYPFTAYLLLNDMINLVPGDVIIQNGANGNVGMALIQIAKARGIRTINIITSRETTAEEMMKKQLLGLGADIVLTYDELEEFGDDYSKWLGNLPKPKLAIDCIAGIIGSELAHHLAQNGLFVNYGAMSGDAVAIDPADYMFKRITSRGFYLGDHIEYTDRCQKELAPYVTKLIKEGKYQAPQCQLYRFDDYENAMKKGLERHRIVKPLLIMDNTLMN